MKKTKKSWKIWIVIAFISAFLIACGAIVYAGNGLFKSFWHYKISANTNELTIDDWNWVMESLDSLNM